MRLLAGSGVLLHSRRGVSGSFSIGDDHYRDCVSQHLHLFGDHDHDTTSVDFYNSLSHYPVHLITHDNTATSLCSLMGPTTAVRPARLRTRHIRLPSYFRRSEVRPDAACWRAHDLA